MSKALGLLSGGLDSTLAAVLLRRQGIDVTCIAFVTPFFGSARAEKAAAALDLPLIIAPISDIHLEMVKSPRYGYGRNFNPCIDCHALMFRLAGRVLEERGFDFLFSGEVLGQRPMSQNQQALATVAQYSGFGERILRPLSAKHLPETAMERDGLVDREQLLDLHGRSRRPQQALADAWGVVDYPSSGGGCLLTEERFADRLRDLLTHDPAADVAEVERLKVGRHFRLTPTAKLLLGRDQADNDQLRSLCRPGERLLRAAAFNGPTGLLVGAADGTALNLAAAIVAGYGKGQSAPRVEVNVSSCDGTQTYTVTPASREASQKLIV